MRAPANVTRSKDQAQTEIEGLLTQVQGGGDFAALTRKHSDCPSAREGGDLGMFGRGQMVEAFDAATFGLPVGGTSGVVETPFGFHLIRRTA